MNTLVNILRIVANNLFVAILFFSKRKYSDHKKILLIKLEGLGDFIIFLPSLIRYKKIYPNHELTLLVDNTINYSIAKRYGKDIVDNVIMMDAKKFSKKIGYRFKISKLLYKENFDLTINPIYYRRKISDFIVRVTKSTTRISFKGYEIEKMHYPMLMGPYTQLVDVPEIITNEFYRHKHLIETLGYTKSDPTYHPTFPLEKDDLEKAHNILREHNLQEKSYVVIFPGAGRAVSKWEPEKFAEVADYVARQGLQIIICGSKTEKDRAQIIINNAHEETRKLIMDLTDSTDVFTTAGIIHLAKYYIGNDSGPTHLAEGIGQTVVCPLGLGHFMEFFPSEQTPKNIIISATDRSCLNDAYACAKNLPADSPAQCVINITTAQVIQGIKQIP